MLSHVDMGQVKMLTGHRLNTGEVVADGGDARGLSRTREWAGSHPIEMAN
jgi:hypothetical protein